jgi:hypothetical protein
VFNTALRNYQKAGKRSRGGIKMSREPRRLTGHSTGHAAWAAERAARHSMRQLMVPAKSPMAMNPLESGGSSIVQSPNPGIPVATFLCVALRRPICLPAMLSRPSSPFVNWRKAFCVFRSKRIRVKRKRSDMLSRMSASSVVPIVTSLSTQRIGSDV